MSHYIAPGGAFDVAVSDLAANGFKLSWSDWAEEAGRPPAKHTHQIQLPRLRAEYLGKS